MREKLAKRTKNVHSDFVLFSFMQIMCGNFHRFRYLYGVTQYTYLPKHPVSYVSIFNVYAFGTFFADKTGYFDNKVYCVTTHK